MTEPDECVAVDRAILACYGREDIDLRHSFCQNGRGQIRYTVSPEARRELLRRLVELNSKLSEMIKSKKKGG